MAFEFSDKYLKSTITKEDLDGIAGEVDAAVKTLEGRNGAGSDFLGWVDLPVNYDREEVARVVAAAEKIKIKTERLKNENCTCLDGGIDDARCFGA